MELYFELAKRRIIYNGTVLLHIFIYLFILEQWKKDEFNFEDTLFCLPSNFRV